MSGTIEWNAELPGLDGTLTIKAFPDGSDTSAATYTPVEATNRKGFYTCSTDLSGWHLLQFYRNGSLIASGFALLRTSGRRIVAASREQALLAAILQAFAMGRTVQTDLGDGTTRIDFYDDTNSLFYWARYNASTGGRPVAGAFY